jgi:CheY-like chemotaxis protein
VTGYASTKDRDASIAAGYQAHVAKPLEPADLVATIVKLVNGGK